LNSNIDQKNSEKNALDDVANVAEFACKSVIVTTCARGSEAAGLFVVRADSSP
jgi:hypothetical protein